MTLACIVRGPIKTFSESTGQDEPEFNIGTPQDSCTCSNCLGHNTNMAATLIYVKKMIFKIFSPDPESL